MKSYLSLVKFSHTIFAMPFAILGFSLASKTGGELDWAKLFLVIGCMVTARNAAMAFNRYLDRDFDKKNSRTAVREIPSGTINEKNALIFIILNIVLFCLFTYFINQLCFYLSPIALLVILGYSYTKRFTFLCHIILGIGLALAPIGAYLAIIPKFEILSVLLGFAVLLWVSGFDIIYALQDAEFDQNEGLFSIPSYFGKKNALTISRMLHVGCSLLIGYIIFCLRTSYPSIGYLSVFAGIFFICMLIYQQSLVKVNDLSKINIAFFTANGVASLIFCTMLVTDLFTSL
jgi:4-hydroxybenzoate polyprenyltransferase